MAKGKHATALFEVIHASKQFGGKDKAAGLLRTPKWWFKGKQTAENDPTQKPRAKVEPPAAAARPAPAEPAHASSDADPIEPDLEYDPTMPKAEPARAASSHASSSSIESSSSESSESFASTSSSSRAPAVDVLMDPDRHRITFRVTYTSAIVTAFAILVCVALAYVVGRQMSRGPAQAMGGPSTESVRNGAARPDVLDVGRGARRDTTSEPDDAISSVGPQPRNNPAPVRTQTPAPPIVAPNNGKRVTGLNYVIIQSYPDEASAKAAVDVLKQHGVESTIEKGLRGYTSGWFIVVGTDGFARISAPEYVNYLKKIESISDKFANKRSFRAFQPSGYKWDRP